MYDEDKAAYAETERIGSKLPLTNQEKTIAELHETINQLTSRLKPVLTPVPEVDRNTNEGRDVVSQSPIAEQLDANNRSISLASRNLRGLMERLEC
jgi:archaellum component FlaC